MKTLLIGLGHENIGLQYLSSFLKSKGIETSIFNAGVSIAAYYLMGNLLNKIPYNKEYLNYTLSKIKEHNPDLIAFSVTTDHFLWAKTISEKIKKFKDIKIIWGGPHPSAVPEIVIKESFIDYVCIGEGEEALYELCEALQNKKPADNIKNIWSKTGSKIHKNDIRPPIKNLDELPFPDRDNFFKEHKSYTDVYSVITSRGCPYKCSFCANTVLQKIYENYSFVRRRSPQNVITELKIAKKENITHILFADDIFTLNKSWLKEFLISYKKEINLPFTCEIHPAHIDQETLTLLEEANCASAGFGLQSIGDEIRNNILKRSDTKEQIIKTILLFQTSPIYLYVDILLDVPTQDKKELIETANFLNTYKPDMILPFNLKYYPSLPITDYAKNLNILSAENITDINAGKAFKPFSIGKGLNKEISALSSLILGARVLPKSVFNTIVKHELYKFNIGLTNVLFHIYCIASDIVLMIKKKKRMFFYFPLFKQIKYYINFLITIKIQRKYK